MNKTVNADTEKLTKRANKTNSTKRIIPYEYILNKNNVSLLETIVDVILSNRYSFMDSIYTLCNTLLRQYNIYSNANVQQVLSDYNTDCCIISELSQYTLPMNEFDFIGAVYQSLLLEGNKNSAGSYYTPQKISLNMTKDFNFSAKQNFLDPCCGSGSFLLSLDCQNPECIYGLDNDKIAVLIAKTNLLCKYNNYSFMPNVYCIDYIEKASLSSDPIANKYFDYICTNPPWGAVINNKGYLPLIKSNETFSIFFVLSFEKLKPNGSIRFLFPESILNVKVHKDIRAFLLNNCAIDSITFYNEAFTGVLTSYVDILAYKSAPNNAVNIIKDEKTFNIPIENFKQTENLVFSILENIDMTILEKIRAVSPYTLTQSKWGLGIITGNNKEKLFDTPLEGMEQIYTGKEITKYSLKPAHKYIVFDRKQLQQVAKDEIYRSPEKLVYKFISNKLVFAYDDSQSLFLNSANILIPSIAGMSTKTVMAFLNSDLYSFLYKKLFNEIKILKGNLLQLPFPKISTETDKQIEQIVSKIIISQDAVLIEELQKIIYQVFELTEEEILYIKSQI